MKRLLCVIGLGVAVSMAVSADNDLASPSEPIVNEYLALDEDDFFALVELGEPIVFEDPNLALIQAAIFHLTNHEREEAGRDPFDYRPDLEMAARLHAQAMSDHNFYSHRSPLSGMERVGDRLAHVGVETNRWGENITQVFGIHYTGGGVYTPPQTGGHFAYELDGNPIPPRTALQIAEDAVAGWMNSPGHRRNILNSRFQYLGVGTAHFYLRRFHDMDSFYAVQKFAGVIHN